MRIQPSILITLALACSANAAPDPRVQSVIDSIKAEDIDQSIRTLVGFGTRHTLSDTESATRGIGAARNWLKQAFERCAEKSQGRMQVDMDAFIEPVGRRVDQPTRLVNVVATLKGSASPERVLVVSGHYDSRVSDVMNRSSDAPGANDDASGTAAVLAMACAFAPHRFPATLVFMTVAGEEQGLLGAEHWAAQARKDQRNIIAMITNDIIGSPVGDQGQRDDQQVRLFADGLSPLLKLVLSTQKNQPDQTALSDTARAELSAIATSGGEEDTPTHQLGRYLKSTGEAYLPGFKVNLITRKDRFLRGGDHLPFLERGYAAVRFSEPFENFNHQHQDLRRVDGLLLGDLPEFVDMNYVAQVARINAAGLASLALAPAAPQQVAIEVSELTNDTTLRWQDSSDPETQDYRIYWREAGSLLWQHQLDVGRRSRHTLKGISKDNYVFGVAALNASGQASLPVFPRPFSMAK